MYISIDIEKLKFLHKHPDYKVVCNLDFICGAIQKTHVGPVERGIIFSHLTMHEMSVLYKNMTGETAPKTDLNLCLLVSELAELFPVTIVDPFEAEVQANYLEKVNPLIEPGYIYVYGAKLPKRVDDFLFPTLAPLTNHQQLEAITKHNAALVQRARVVAAATPTPTPSEQPAQPRATARTTASRPRSGVCKQIWEVLDQERAKLGEQPSRARIKELASQYGWKPSTASVQSAAWRKENNLP